MKRAVIKTYINNEKKLLSVESFFNSNGVDNALRREIENIKQGMKIVLKIGNMFSIEFKHSDGVEYNMTHLDTCFLSSKLDDYFLN